MIYVWFCIVVNNSLNLSSGQDAIVRSDVHITIDCKQLIDDLKNKGESNPIVTWTKDGNVITNNSVVNVFISNDKRFAIITKITVDTGGQIGNDGNYTCKVCGGGGTADCKRNTSCLKVCGEMNLF